MFGLITGSGFYDIPDLDRRSVESVETPYGEARLTTGDWRGRPIAFVPRHGANHRVSPAAINYLSLIHISEPTRLGMLSRMPSSA